MNTRRIAKIVLSGLSLLTVMVLALSGCSRSKSLVGEWRSEIGDGRLTVVFEQDGRFSVQAPLRQSTNEAVLTFQGTYSVIDTNRLRLNLAADRGTNTFPITIQYAMAGDELQLQEFGGAEGRVMKYRRVH